MNPRGDSEMVAIDLWELGYTNEVFSSSLGKRP